MKDFVDSVYLSNFGLTLKELRHSRGFTQEQLANLLNVTPSSITMYEAGARNPSIKILLKLSNIFDISIDELINVFPKQYTNINEAFLGISAEEFNSLTNEQKQSIRDFIAFIKNKKQ